VRRKRRRRRRKRSKTRKREDRIPGPHSRGKAGGVPGAGRQRGRRTRGAVRGTS